MRPTRAHSLGSAPANLTDRPIVWLIGLSGSVTDQLEVHAHLQRSPPCRLSERIFGPDHGWRLQIGNNSVSRRADRGSHGGWRLDFTGRLREPDAPKVA